MSEKPIRAGYQPKAKGEDISLGYQPKPRPVSEIKPPPPPKKPAK